MTLQPPNLDDRHFADIFTELRERIPSYCPEWTEYHDSDPGITLMQLFASMTEQLLYRMNQMPRLHYIRFLQLLGIELDGPKAAKADVTFWLTEAQPTGFTIDAGTEISTTQTEDKIPIIFSTLDDFKVQQPQLSTILTAKCKEINSEPKGGLIDAKEKSALLPTRSVMIESDKEIFPSTDDGAALVFGFSTNVSRHLVRLKIVVDQLAIKAADGLDPSRPPWIWEARVDDELNNERWVPCKVDKDSSGGMSNSGDIDIHLPANMTHISLDSSGTQQGSMLYWLRVRLVGQTSISEYRTSPRLNGVDAVEAIGCTIPAEHSRVVSNEVIGISTGTPAQRFYLNHTPVLPRHGGSVLPECVMAAVSEDSGGYAESWTEVSDFAQSAISPLPLHYTLDSLTGEVRFGPAIRLPDGSIREYGATPAVKEEIKFIRYRTGGGIEGNVTSGQLNTLKTSIPFVKRVENQTDAFGGTDAQDIEEALLQAPNKLRSRERAVTLEDFEYLALREFSGVFSRAKCLPLRLPEPLLKNNQPKSNTESNKDTTQPFVPIIDMRVIPHIENAAGSIEPEMLMRLPDKAKDDLVRYLDDRRLLCTTLSIDLPRYHWVATRVTIQPIAGASVEVIQPKLLRRLYRLLNPLTGGLDGRGWPFGHDLHTWEVYQCLMQSGSSEPFGDDELDVSLFRVLHIELFERKNQNDPTTVDLDTQELERKQDIRVDPEGVIASLRHQIIIPNRR